MHKNLLKTEWYGAFIIWVKVLKNGPSKICGRQPLKNLMGYGLLEADHIPPNFLKLSSTSFPWSILKYFVPSEPFRKPKWAPLHWQLLCKHLIDWCLKMSVINVLKIKFPILKIGWWTQGKTSSNLTTG